MSKFLSMRISFWLRRNKASRSTIPYHDAQSVGVIFCILGEALLPGIDSFIHQLQNDHKKVTVLAYFPNKTKHCSCKYDYFTTENISFWGSFKNDQIISFVKEPFDYLFHLDEFPSTVIQGILAQSNAKCRIGKYATASDRYYELMINTEKKDYLQEIYNYTSILS